MSGRGRRLRVLAEQEQVDIRTYSIIYDAINDIKKALEGLLEPTYKEHFLGRAQVIEVFNIRKWERGGQYVWMEKW